MRAYRSLWNLATTVLVLVSGVAAGLAQGWATVAVLSALAVGYGLVLGLAWFEDPAVRWRAMTRCAWWSVAATLVILGAGPRLGAWTVLAVLTIGASAPDVVVLLRGSPRSARPARRPERWSDEELARRWRRTTDEITDGAVSPRRAAQLAEERAGLLDELERRDPQRFAARLAQLGWREPLEP